MDLEVEKAVIYNIQNEFMNEISKKAPMSLINSSGCLEAYIEFVCKKNFRGCNILSKNFNL